jgi:protease IV
MRRKRVLIGLGVIAGLLVFFFSLLVFLGGRESRTGRFSFGDKIAIVEIKGVISDSADVLEEIRGYGKDDSIKAIILRIDSPGGGVAPSQEIYREIVKLKQKKKVLTSMGSVAASGGYYIACASDYIVANPGSLTGSIGVIMEFTNLEELLKKIGVKGIVLKGGEHKDIGSPFREITPEERKIMQDVINNVHDQFIRAVAEGRKMDKSKVIPVADGRVLTGEQAKQSGLIDQMGNLEDTIDVAAKMANIDGRPTVIYPKKKIGLWELLAREMTSKVMDTLQERGFRLSYR